MPSGLEFITGALHDLGVLAEGEAPSGQEAADALIVLNQMADALGIERLILYEIVRTTQTLTASTASYTIGTGGTINIVRPVWIDHAGLVVDTTATPPVEIPISVLTDDEYARWPSKTLTSTQPYAIWYDYKWTAGLGTVFVLPIPTVSTTQLVLYTPGVAVAQFANLSTVYTFPPGYQRALRKNLALEIAPMFHASPSPLLVNQAIESKAAIKRANHRPSHIQCDPALVGPSGTWNI